MPRINVVAMPALSPLLPLSRRQIVVSSDGDGGGDGGLSGGAIAGIVIGSVVGFILLLWMLRCCISLGAQPIDSWYDEGRRGYRSDRYGRYEERRGRSQYYRQSYPVRTSSRRRYSAEVPITTTERISVTEPVPVVVRSHSAHRHGRTGRYYKTY